MGRVRRDFQVLADLEDPISDSFSDLLFLEEGLMGKTT